MGDDELTFSMSVPLDSDGFLRRECPTCEREFKWFASSDEVGSEPVPDGGYFCPYCGVQAPTESWHTKAQVAQATSIIQREVVEPELEEFRRSVSDISHSSGGLFNVSVEIDIDLPDVQPEPLIETDDMRRVDFACHPAEPVKVPDDWSRPVRCLICGATA